MKRFGTFRKKMIAAAMAGAMTLGLAACGSESGSSVTSDTTPDTVEDTTADTEESTTAQRRDVTPMQMSVNKETGEMNITRPELEGTPMGEEGTWTIFVYLCGSDLESNNGSATSDISEMAQATESEKVRFVIQTGGSNSWNFDSIDPEKSQRFVVENGDITNVYESEKVDMGDPDVLTDYLTWGLQNYPADNMGLILWNHGNGAIHGVCFDEQHDSDSLTLRELDSSLLSAQQYMTEKWEFIGFDACLMGNIEAANILANYAKYMYGSEEAEPGAGWNYVEIGNYLAENPTASGADLGPTVCDSFFQGCKDAGDYDVCTLAVIDLSKINDVITSFNTFAKDIYEKGENADALSNMLRAIKGSEAFGPNNDNEGYTNMIDLGGLVTVCDAYSTNGDAVIAAIQEAVLYKIHGDDHPNACGLSTYFPLEVQGSNELKTFSDVCVSPYYMSFIDRQDYSAAYYSNDENNQKAEEEQDYYKDEENNVCYFVQDGEQYCYYGDDQTYAKYNPETEEWEQVESGELDAQQYEYCSSGQCCGDYSDEELYDDDGNWSYNSEYDYDSTTKSYRSKPTQTKHFDYADNYVKSGESKHIKFLKKPSMNKDNNFGFTLTKYSLDHTSDVYANVYQLVNDNEILVLGDTYDVDCDWADGTFQDMFDGYWLSLPDGQNLSMVIVDKNDDFVIFSAPIKLNGVATNLRIRHTIADGTFKIEGAWDGIAESGAASRNCKKLKDGDKIVPVYKSFTMDNRMTEIDYEGQEFTISGELELVYGLMNEGDFLYAFIIEDIYNDYIETDLVAFNVDADGKVSFYEE